MAPTDVSDEAQGRELQELTNAMVQLYKDLFGRGPTKARAGYAGPDTLLITLEGSLTAAEKNLAALNERQRLRETRMSFKHASERTSPTQSRASSNPR